MKIIYVHGLGSGANSSTGALLREIFIDDDIVCAEMPIKPLEALSYLKDLVNKEKPDLVIGTSLGGFYTMQIAGVKKLLINPALDADNDIKNVIGLGEYNYFCTRSDGIQKYTVDEQMIKDLAFLKNRFYSEWLDWEVKSEVFSIFGNSDDLFSHKDIFKRMFRKTNMFEIDDMGHRLTKDSIKKVKPIVKNILSKNNLFNLY